MKRRRHADQLLDGSEIPTCLAEVGWIGEALSSLTIGRRLWLPHPVSCPGRLRWQSKRQAVGRLAALTQSENLPRRARIQGNDHASLAEISSRLLAAHSAMERVFVPGRAFRFLERWSARKAYVGCRLVHGAKESDPAPDAGYTPENALQDWVVFSEN